MQLGRAAMEAGITSVVDSISSFCEEEGAELNTCVVSNDLTCKIL